MDEILTYSISVFTGFFAIMNPVSNIPIFLSLATIFFILDFLRLKNNHRDTERTETKAK